MIDRILKTYGEVNTTVKHFPPEKTLQFDEQARTFLSFMLKATVLVTCV